MEQNKSNSKLIAKNAIFLYIRMIVMMVTSLFTSREVLRVLGITDFGIYGVIGGVIVLFSFFQSALTSSSLRFFSFEIGKGTACNLSKSFSSSLNLHIILSLLIFILSETIGLWFVYNYLNIPEHRFESALVLYQFVIFIFIANILRTPFNSAIIAYEKMSFYAYISLVEAFLKLCVVYLICVFPVDRLILYGVLLFIVAFGILVIYYVYVKVNFPACRIQFVWDSEYMKSMVLFSGWSLLGGVSNVSAQQGCNMLLNIFKGVSVNAAFGIANQVSQAIYQLSSNLLNAFSPQITKLYSSNNTQDLYKLVYRSSLACFYMMLIIALPISFKMNFILETWLSDVPDYADTFSILMILYLLIETLQGPLITLVHATGIIKSYYIWISAIILMCFPLSWISLLYGINPNIIILIRVLINLITYIFIILYLSSLTKMSIRDYFSNVICRCIIVLTLSLTLLYAYTYCFKDDLLHNCLYIIVSALCIIVIVFVSGFNKVDRQFIFDTLLSKLLKIKDEKRCSRH